MKKGGHYTDGTIIQHDMMLGKDGAENAEDSIELWGF